MIRGIAKTIYHWIGWKLEGRYPHEIKKKIIIVAPHTSKVDFFVGILVKFWLDLRVTFYAKQELFKGIIGWFLRSIGGRPVDRIWWDRPWPILREKTVIQYCLHLKAPVKE